MKKLITYLIYFLLLSGCRDSIDKAVEPNVSSGVVERIEDFESQYVSPRNIDVWLPDNYSNKEKYAVLYMHDGQMLFDSTTTWNKQEWGTDETITELLQKEEIQKVIVVGIWNTEFRHSEYFPQKPFEDLHEEFRDSLLNPYERDQGEGLFKTPVCSDLYLRFIVQELKPYIDHQYSTLADMKNTFIAGSSMGGLISIYALCEYPEVFSGAGCLSTHWPGIFDTLNNPIPQKFAEYFEDHLPDPENHAIYFDRGTETLDAIYGPSQLMMDSMVIARGYREDNFKTLIFKGQDHSEKSWSKRLEIPFRFLLRKEEMQKDNKN